MEVGRSIGRDAAWLLWPCLIGLSVGVAVIALFLPGGSPVRVAATLWFVLVCPGMAYVRLLAVADALIEFGLAVVLSICLATIVSLAMVYLKLWHPEAALYLLAAIALFGVVLQLRVGYGSRRDPETATP